MTEPSATGSLGPVLVIGTGLIGTSIALALVRAGVEVVLRDEDAEQLATAIGMSALRTSWWWRCRLVRRLM